MKRKKDEGQAHSSLHLIVEQRVHDYLKRANLVVNYGKEMFIYKPVRQKRLVNVLGMKLNKRCSLFREVSLFSHLLLNTISSLSAGIIFCKKKGNMSLHLSHSP